MTSYMTNVEGHPERSKRVEICGGIASGKTTFADLMRIANHRAVFENFRLNPFIENFYSDPDFYSFETEISFLLQHYSQIKTEAREPGTYFCDYSLYLDESYAQVTLTSSHLTLFQSLHSTVVNEVGPPDLLVYLRCSPATELGRIRARQRAMEKTISLDYLNQINEALAGMLQQTAKSTQIVEVNSDELDFAHDQQTRMEMVNLITAALE